MTAGHPSALGMRVPLGVPAWTDSKTHPEGSCNPRPKVSEMLMVTGAPNVAGLGAMDALRS